MRPSGLSFIPRKEGLRDDANKRSAIPWVDRDHKNVKERTENNSIVQDSRDNNKGNTENREQSKGRSGATVRDDVTEHRGAPSAERAVRFTLVARHNGDRMT